MKQGSPAWARALTSQRSDLAIVRLGPAEHPFCVIYMMTTDFLVVQKKQKPCTFAIIYKARGNFWTDTELYSITRNVCLL